MRLSEVYIALKDDHQNERNDGRALEQIREFPAETADVALTIPADDAISTIL